MTFKDVWEFVTPYLSPQTITAILILFAAGYIKDAAKKFIAQTRDSTALLEKQVKLLSIRQNKIMAIMAICPSVPKDNVWWLKDDSRNSKPPSESACEQRDCLKPEK